VGNRRTDFPFIRLIRFRLQITQEGRIVKGPLIVAVPYEILHAAKNLVDKRQSPMR
jgi:hypothetical protein